MGVKQARSAYAPVVAYGPAVALCTITDPGITESSGLVASSLQSDVLFTHNDSGDTARFFAIGTDCGTRAVYELPGVKARDWEDLARGPGAVLWLGDIGDNRGRRTTVTVVRVAEPVVAATNTRPLALASTSFALTYPDGPHNAETLLADRVDGRLYVLTKNVGGSDALYAAPLPLLASAVNRLAKLDSVTFPGLFGSLTTGGDISPDGTRLVVRTYENACELAIPAAPGSGPRLAGVFAHGLGTPIALAAERQGEAIAFSRDGRSLLTTSEGTGQPLYQLPLAVPSVRPTPSPASPSQARTGVPARSARVVLSAWVAWSAGSAAAVGAMALAWLLRRRLRRT